MIFHIRRVARNVFDVFEGNQWSSWSRLKAGRNGVYVAQGDRLSYATTKALAAAINPINEVQDVSL